MTFWTVQEDKKISPVTNYRDWKSDKEAGIGTFNRRDKEKEEEIKDVPEEFILLETTSCVKWWDTVNNCGIYSNEIKNVKNEAMVVRSFKGGTLFEGTYDKDTIEKLWGKFHKGIIVQNGETLEEYYLKWGALFAFNENMEKIDYQNYKIKFDWVEEKKKWAITYYVPKWIQGKKITLPEREVAMNSVSLLEDYFRGDTE